MRCFILIFAFLSFSLSAACPQWPLLIAHRGASGYLPEHSLAAYRKAIEQGADLIELDLVPTRDGVLISRHENELSASTNVASLAQFASRKTRKKVDGLWIEGWFSEDFTLAELKQLRLKESMPDIRPESATYDGKFQIVTLSEVIEFAAEESQKRGKSIGLYLETKHPTYFKHEGKTIAGDLIATDLNQLLVATLKKQQHLLPDLIYIQSFEITNLVELKQKWLPQSGVNAKLIQLLGDTKQAFLPPAENFSIPYDIHYFSAHNLELAVEKLFSTLQKKTDLHFHYGLLTTAAGLDAIAQYADGIGPWRSNLYQRVGDKLDVVQQAHQRGLAVHPYTYRAEQRYLIANHTGQLQTLADEFAWLFSQGIDGVFTDFPDIAYDSRLRQCQSKASH